MRAQAHFVLVAAVASSLFAVEALPIGNWRAAEAEAEALVAMDPLLATLLNHVGGRLGRDKPPPPGPKPEEFFKAAGWEGVIPPENRFPVVFVPPFAGVKLSVKLSDRPKKSPLDYLCVRDTGGEWIPAWLPGKANQGPFELRCMIYNLAFGRQNRSEGGGGRGPPPPPPPGVESSFDESFEGGMCLDDACTAPIFGPWAQALELAGWRRGFDIESCNYDWRKGPDAYAEPGGAFDVLRATIESVVARTGRRAVVAAMSMGSPLAALFLAQYAGEAWKADHLEAFVSLSGSFGGSTSPLFSVLTGAWAKLIPQPLHRAVRTMARSMGSPAWMFPSEAVFGERVFVQTPQKGYAAGGLEPLLARSGAGAALDFWRQFRNQTGAEALAPDVATHCFYGVGVASPATLTFKSESMDEVPAMSWADGDGTCLLDSLAACGGFEAYQAAPVRTVTFDNVTHSDILRHLEPFVAFASVVVADDPAR